MSYPKFDIESNYMSELDQDFESLLAQINVKLNEAAVKLKEANELRKKVGFPSFIFTDWMSDDVHSELYRKLNEQFTNDEKLNNALNEAMGLERAKYKRFDVRALEAEIEHAGWSTSSSYC